MGIAELKAREAIRESVRGCTSCGLHTSCTRPVPFSGPSPSRVVVVGEAPGEREDVEGRPFVGPSGTLARAWIDKLQVGDIAWVNVVSCYPHRTPTRQEVNACRGNLERQLSHLRPTYALLLGGVAVSSWWPRVRMGEIRGLWWRANVRGMDEALWALATWHPAAVLRNRHLQRDVDEDLDVFAMVLEQGAPPVSRWCIKCQKREITRWEGDLGYCDLHDPEKHKRQGRLL